MEFQILDSIAPGRVCGKVSNEVGIAVIIADHSVKEAPGFVHMAILRVDDFETEIVGTGFLLSAESTQGQIGNADAETPAPFTES